MTDHFPDATKMVLSPTAQAVLWAGLGRDSDRLVIAAALRAAADQVAPETPFSEPDDPAMLQGIWSERRTIRQEILAIAGELEDTNDH